MPHVYSPGSDAANDVQKTEERMSYRQITTSTTTVVKSGAGLLHVLEITANGATGNVITVYDNTAGSGTVIWSCTAPAQTIPHNHVIDAAFSTGLTIVTAGTTPPQLTVTYR